MALHATLQTITPPDGAKARLPGLLLISLITFSLLWLANIPKIAHWGPGSLTLAILIGIVLGNSVYPRIHSLCDPGVQWAKQYLLRWGIILYGFRLSFQQVAAVGFTGIAVDLTVVTLTFLLACWIGKRWLKLDNETVILIGAGSSICGAAAIMATAPVVKASGNTIAVAVSTVVIFGTTAMFLYPWLYQLNLEHQWIEATPQIVGLYFGSTIHEVAQAVAAGHAVDGATENIAVISKMLRVMMLAPFLLMLGFFLKKTTQKSDAENAVPLMFPWFALGFIAVAAFNSFSLLSPTLVIQLVQLDNVLLTMAMVALGLTTRFSAIRQAGAKPLLLALILFLWLVIGGAGINLFFEHLFS
ncbi:YeiH family protein [Pectobacterium betavasculorum]|uniref:Membrane protein n=1 Tax=Pectobacterium betavasculorum TaxID=55207 RepID=A0ABR4V4Y5_9GAMM|nr:YeiH family protein [Pectobacterium betavasculorum]KFX22601.1 membrane protein [Pectobacterium betavasculorum]